MKRTFVFCLIFIVLLGGCIQQTKKSEEINRVENTLKSISLLYDSIGINPTDLLSIFEKVNKAIDSIGYPDAGYKLWLIQSDSIKHFRFMVEGHWPNQAIYDTIHNNTLYRNSLSPEDKKVWRKMNNISYNRFTLVE